MPGSDIQEVPELRPSDWSEEDSDYPFYLAVNLKWKNGVWFKKQPMGVNKIALFVPEMVKSAGIGLDRKLTNTSYRKSLAKKLNEFDVPKNIGRHITGHKNASSLDNYSALSAAQQYRLSNIVAGSALKPVPVYPAITRPSSTVVAPSAEGRAIAPSAQGRAIAPSAEGRAIAPSAQGRAIAPSAEGRAIAPSAEGRAIMSVRVAPSQCQRKVVPSHRLHVAVSLQRPG